MHFLMGTEAVLGFALLTASVSWILSIYPVIEHRRSLAEAANLLHFAEANGIRRLDQVPDDEFADILLTLVGQMITHHNELVQFPITYFFDDQDLRFSLAAILPYLADISAQNTHRGGSAAIAATSLGGAIDEFLKVIAEYYLRLPFTSREEILRAFAADHCREMIRAPRPRSRAA